MMSMELKRTLVPFIAAGTLVAGLSAVSGPPRNLGTSAPVASCQQVPDAVRATLGRACLDCHSDETRWPWYNRLPGVSWLVRHDVKQGREHLDFSTWTANPAHQATANEIQEICDAVSNSEMPPRRYQLLHPGAKLSETDKNNFCEWASQMRASTQKTDPGPQAASN
jgi:hypothetical protein